MALASWKDFCIDAVDVMTVGQFWASALGLTFNEKDGNVWLDGPTKQHRIWINEVPEPHTVKNRVHLDVHTGSLADLEALGARPLETFPRWTVMADPEGQEFCAFVRETAPDLKLYELVIDCVDAAALASWWGRVFDAKVDHDGEDHWVEGIAGLPFDGLVFDNVPESKTVKNRVHWDVVAAPDELVAAGATLLRPKAGDLGWHVLADPEGNEFCAFD